MSPASDQFVKVRKDGSGEVKLSDDNARNINVAAHRFRNSNISARTSMVEGN